MIDIAFSSLSNVSDLPRYNAGKKNAVQERISKRGHLKEGRRLKINSIAKHLRRPTQGLPKAECSDRRRHSSTLDLFGVMTWWVGTDYE